MWFLPQSVLNLSSTHSQKLCVYVSNSGEWLLGSSGLLFLPLRSDHVRVELSDDDGDVITVHPCQLLRQ